MTDNENEVRNINNEEENREAESEETKPVEVYSETADAELPQLDAEQIRAAALAYAKYLRDNDLAPGDATFAEPEELGVDLEERKTTGTEETPEDSPEENQEEEPGEEEAPAEADVQEDVQPEEEPEQAEEAVEEAVQKEAPADEGSGKDGSSEKKASKKEEEKQKERKKKQKAKNKKKKSYKKEFMTGGKIPLASITDFHDRAQDKVDGVLVNMGKDFVRGAHSISDGYRNSRRTIGIALLFTGLLVAILLIVFDRFTVYEYTYNGKVLGYVQEQEEVTDVLAIAGKKLSENSSGEAGIEFVANQNVTFRLVDGRGKSTDDSDTVINKLIYMTDIETEAYAIYDGDRIVAIVKSQEDAEALLEQTKEELSVPDRGMTLVSSEFTNPLDAKPVNVLLGSVQSNTTAKNQMINGGKMTTYHIVEEGETAESLAAEFGVEVIDIYNEDNSEVATELEQGDKVCIRSTVEPVSVKMVEEGRIKEVIEFETIKQESDDYYKGDTYLLQDGVNGEQIFEGTITKVGGVETSRKATSPAEVTREKKDKIILVGTAERPKTAATGTFMLPLDHYVVTSEFGGRWGRNHNGIDLGAGTGTPIYASDGGRVIRAGWYSGYGMCIDIDHGNGVMTRYGHCSQIYVNVGDLVYQGQNIGAVGNTGNSFGSHLHFEIRIYDSPKNPRNYLQF